MSKYAPIIATVVLTLATAFSSQGQTFVAAHPAMASVLALVASVLHAVLPSIFAAKQ